MFGQHALACRVELQHSEVKQPLVPVFSTNKDSVPFIPLSAIGLQIKAEVPHTATPLLEAEDKASVARCGDILCFLPFRSQNTFMFGRLEVNHSFLQ